MLRERRQTQKHLCWKAHDHIIFVCPSLNFYLHKVQIQEGYSGRILSSNIGQYPDSHSPLRASPDPPVLTALSPAQGQCAGLPPFPPSSLSLCLRPLSAFPGWSACGMVAILSFHAFVLTPFGGPSPPSSLAIHISVLSSFIPSPPWLTGLRIPTRSALFLSLRLHCLILGISWLWAFVWAAGLSLCLCLSVPPPSLPSPSSRCPLWDMYFYLPLICSLLFVEE